MKIGGYLKTSLIEWPGQVVAVVFTKGCNFRCPYCHNPQLVKSEGQRVESEETILQDIKKRKQWLDGVVFTGGEPTLQPDLIPFLKKVKGLGLKVMVETNGSKPETIVKLLNPPAGRAGCYLVDRFAIDIKGPLDNTYKKIIKLSNYQIANLQKTLQLVVKSGIDFELRTTVIPGIHDEETIGGMARQIVKLSNFQIANFSWTLQTFSPKRCLDPEFKKIKPYSQKEMEKMLRAARLILPDTSLR